MNKHLKYLNYVLRHKWFVFLAGLKTGAPLWRLIIHDYTKFSIAEWSPYVNKFYGGRAGADLKGFDTNEFKLAWKHHWHHNPHHWEYWTKDYTEPINMPWNFVQEMVADWVGAGRTITGTWDELPMWYNKTKAQRVLHPSTKRRVENLLRELGYDI